jgi:ABC-type proline/glycine betaine transport system substrate-binding protein
MKFCPNRKPRKIAKQKNPRGSPQISRIASSGWSSIDADMHQLTMLPVLVLLLGWSADARADYCSSGRNVVFAGLNWESGEFITAVTQEIVERGFGCRSETIPGNTITFEQAVANDDVQIVAEEWINRSEIWKKAAKAGQVRAIGRTFTGATEGWAVPEYMVKGDAARRLQPMAPDLISVAQLADPKYGWAPLSLRESMQGCKIKPNDRSKKPPGRRHYSRRASWSRSGVR